MKGSIYIIRNTINDKVYVGQTTQTINIRFTNHKMASRTGEDTKFYRAMRKHGEENFYPELLERVEVEDLNDRERYWIKYYDSYYNGYNSTLGGDQPYRINYDKVKELWDSGMHIAEIAHTMGHERDAISNILKNMIGVSSEEIKKRGNRSMYSITDEQVLEEWNNGLTPHQIHQKLGSTVETIKKILVENGVTEQEWKIRINNNNRKINPQQVLKLWEQGLCLSDIYRTIYPDHISVHTTTIKKQLIELGINEEEIKNRTKKHVNRNAKPVVQLTLDGKYVATYPSGRQAEIQSGVAKSSAINACCNHKPKYETAGGYKWMFKIEYDALNK
jgi:group I intron endonuclease